MLFQPSTQFQRNEFFRYPIKTRNTDPWLIYQRHSEAIRSGRRAAEYITGVHATRSNPACFHVQADIRLDNQNYRGTENEREL